MKIETINRGSVEIDFPLYAIQVFNGGEWATYDVAEATEEGLKKLESMEVPFNEYEIQKFN